MTNQQEGVNWIVVFEDASVPPVTFTDELAARKYYADRQVSWNCHLFRRADSNFSDPQPDRVEVTGIVSVEASFEQLMTEPRRAVPTLIVRFRDDDWSARDALSAALNPGEGRE